MPSEENVKVNVKLYPVLKRIVYNGPGELNNTIVEPAGKKEKPVLLPFPHLTPAELKLLQRKGVLG